MRATTWTTIAAIAACVSCSAWADDGNHGSDGRNRNKGFESSLVGSAPNTTVGGVASGGAPWVVATSEASVSTGGRLKVEVTGLLIGSGTGVPANLVGTVGSVTMVGASLVCGGSGGSVAGSSDGTPLSAAGNAEIEATITLPSTCVAPAVLVRIFNPSAPAGSQLGRFIALTGFNAGAGASDDDSGQDR